MADSSNGKLDGAENVQPEDVGDSKPVVESVRDVAVDDCSEPAKETRDDADDSRSSSSSSSDEEAEGARVANDSGEVEETEEVVVSVESVYNHLDQGSVVVETKVEEEEKVAESLDETGESSPAIAEEVLKQVEEKTLSYVEESNGVALVETDLVSKEDEKEAVPAAVADIVSKGIEETRLPVSKEQTGESSGTAYKEEVPAVESADAGQDHGKAEIPESTGNPSIVSVAGPPLQPTSWKSCCGLFEILHRRSDR
ncbi:protein gar2 [Pyrus communis]|uniref:protein gar2 n=1 Tax=Pyrus communis TaxID=23211 RepID=UPI0035BF5FAF